MILTVFRDEFQPHIVLHFKIILSEGKKKNPKKKHLMKESHISLENKSHCCLSHSAGTHCHHCLDAVLELHEEQHPQKGLHASAGPRAEPQSSKSHRTCTRCMVKAQRKQNSMEWNWSQRQNPEVDQKHIWTHERRCFLSVWCLISEWWFRPRWQVSIMKKILKEFKMKIKTHAYIL